MAHVGKPLDDWQALMVVDTFGLRADGYWAAFECVGLVSRQNGKGAYTEAVELGGLFLFRDQIIMHSAHLFKTSKQSFQRVVDIIDGSDWLTKRVRKVTRARGDEEIELTAAAGGGRLLYFSRSGGSGRGFTGDKTVFDECAYLTIEQYQAATPTLSTVPNPQIIYTGTPPDEDVGPMPDDAMMPSVRRRGHAGGDRIALWEWSPPEGYDRRDPRVHARCNPSYGIRIQGWFLAKQLDNFTEAGKPEKFDTEHLGVWPDDGGPQWSEVSEDQWLNAGDLTSVASGPLSLHLDMTPDLEFGALAVAGRRADGDLHGEVVDFRAKPETWMLDRVLELVERWSVCSISLMGTGAAFSLYPDLVAGLKAAASLLEVKVMTNREVAAGFGLTIVGLRAAEGARRVRWRPNEYTEALTDGVKGGVSRDIGEGKAWDRDRSPRKTSLIIAVSNAVHTFVSTPVPPPVAVANPHAQAQAANFFRPTGRLRL